MTRQTTYTQARANLAKLCEQVTANRDIVWITRRKGANVALIAADELESLLETAHLLRSPANAARLLGAIGQALGGEGRPESVRELRLALGLAPEA